MNREFPDGPFTASERAQIRRMIEYDRNKKWLRTVIQSSAAWIVGVITAIYMGYDFVAGAVKRMIGGP